MRKLLGLLAVLFALSLPTAAQAAGPELFPPSLSFGKTTVGEESSQLEVQLSNQTEAMTIDSIMVDGDGSFQFKGHSCGYQQAGWPCSFWVSFAPSGAGSKEATATITFKDEVRDALTVPLSGIGAAPELTFQPPSHDFGLLAANRESGNYGFTVINDGEAAVRLGQLELNGPNAFSFGNGQCSNQLLQPGDSCDQEVWFTPQEMGEYEAELRVPTTTATFEAELSGTGGRAIVGADPVGFGASPVGSRGQVRTITLSNSGNLPAAFFIAVIAGGDVGSFRMLSESCTMIQLVPEDTCSVRIRFEPQEAGPLSARLAMFGDGEPTMIQLEGEGTPVEPAAAAGDTVVQYVTYSYASPHRAHHQRLRRGKSLHAGQARYPRRHRLGSAR
jgi:hypothetical protein